MTGGNLHRTDVACVKKLMFKSTANKADFLLWPTKKSINSVLLLIDFNDEKSLIMKIC